MKTFMQGTFAYLMEEGLASMGDHLPVGVQTALLTKGAMAALAENAKIVEPYTPQSWYDEVKGLSDGSGIDYDTIVQLNMIPEVRDIVKASFPQYLTSQCVHITSRVLPHFVIQYTYKHTHV
jgi:hypothetical protein